MGSKTIQQFLASFWAGNNIGLFLIFLRQHDFRKLLIAKYEVFFAR